MKNMFIAAAILVVIVGIFLTSGAAANVVFGSTWCLYTSSGIFGTVMIALSAVTVAIGSWLGLF